MKIKHILKEAKYYKSLGKGQLKRVILRFLLTKTPLKKVVNTPVYNKLYKKAVDKNIAASKPYILQIENTNVCNAKCIMCPHTRMKRKARIMGQKEFETVCKNVLPFEDIKLVTITGFGEPFADQGVLDKIKWLNKNYPKMDIDVYTNASLLKPEISDKLLELKLHKINFSVNGTGKSYKQIMGLDYENTKKNILYFLGRKKELGKKFPLTNISLVIISKNKDEINDVVRFWESRTDSIMAYNSFEWDGKDDSSKKMEKQNRWPCRAIPEVVMVDSEGNAVLCCRDYESKVKFGSLLKDNIKTVRKGRVFQELMKKQKNLDFETPICATCDNAADSRVSWW